MARPVPPSMREVARELDARVQALGYEVVELEWAGSSARPLIRIRIDRAAGEPAGVNVDDCARVSRALESWLDEVESMPERYVLEVSSPGLDRPLRHEADYRRFAGRLAKIVTTQPIERQSAFAGRIAGIEKGAVILEEGRKTHRVPLDRIKRAHLDVEF